MEFQCTVHLLVGRIGLRSRPSTHLLGEGFRLRIIQLRLRRKLLRRRDEIPFLTVERTIPIQFSMPTLYHRPVVCGMPCALVPFNNIKLGPLQVVIFIIVQITRHSIRKLFRVVQTAILHALWNYHCAACFMHRRSPFMVSNSLLRAVILTLCATAVISFVLHVLCSIVIWTKTASYPRFRRRQAAAGLSTVCSCLANPSALRTIYHQIIKPILNLLQ